MTGSIYDKVPKPPALLRGPHIGQMPVPWVTCYGTGGYLMDTTSPLGLTLGCHCVLGEGKPELGKQCPVRQRVAMTQRRCNACGGQIKDEALFAGVYITDEVPGASKVPITGEAPTHPRCLAYSALVCPTLAGRPETCLVFPVAGAYPLVDRWVFVDGDPDKTRFVAHDTPRHHPLVRGKAAGALDYVCARLDLPGQRATVLADWMTRSAPQPYRNLWKELHG